MSEAPRLKPEPDDPRPFSAALEDCVAAVVDGRPVDWSRIRSGLPLQHEQALLDGLEGLHRLGLHSQHATSAAGLGQGVAPEIPPENGTAGSTLPARALLTNPTNGGSAASVQDSIPPAEDAEPDFDAQDLPFPRWGPLALRARIGTGAFGEVFLAHDDKLGRNVALKLFSPYVALPAGGALALVREARRLARVRQENVVDVYGADIHEGRAGFWMEYVKGETLEQRLAVGGRFHGWEALWVGMQLSRALAAIHAAGLLHLDVKASNVLREDGGRIVLTDFGAVVEAESHGAAAAAARMATPLAAAPELLRGEPPTVAADIYALGALLYRLVTRVHPVEGSSVEELRERHARSVRPRLRELRTELPLAFVAVVERALSADPLARFASAAEMEGALREAAAAELGLPLAPARRVAERVGGGEGAVAPAVRPGGTRRWWQLAGVVLLGLITLVAGAITLAPGRWAARSSYFYEDFAAPDTNELLRGHWQLLNPEQEHWRLPHAQGRLTLYTLRGDLWTKDQEQPIVLNMLARPFTRGSFRVTTLLTGFNPQHNWQQAGIVVLDDPDQYVRLTVGYDEGTGPERSPRLIVGSVFEEGGTVVAQPTVTLKPYDGRPLQNIWLQVAKDGDNVILRYRLDADYGPFTELAHRQFRLRQRSIALAAFQGITQELPGGARQPLTWDPVPANFDYVSVEPLR